MCTLVHLDVVYRSPEAYVSHDCVLKHDLTRNRVTDCVVSFARDVKDGHYFLRKFWDSASRNSVGETFIM